MSMIIRTEGAHNTVEWIEVTRLEVTHSPDGGAFIYYVPPEMPEGFGEIPEEDGMYSVYPNLNVTLFIDGKEQITYRSAKRVKL